MNINLFWTIIYYLLFMLFSIFFVICAFIGIYMEAYRELKAEEGYRDDYKVWSFLDYLLWVLGCFKKDKLRQNIEEYLKDRNEKSLQKLKDRRKLKTDEKNTEKEDKESDGIEEVKEN